MSFVDGDYRDYMNKGMYYDRFLIKGEDMMYKKPMKKNGKKKKK